MRILIVDDIDANRELLARIVASMGYTAHVASSGSEAVELVGFGEVDLIFMDLQMPGVDGFEATRRIRDLGGQAVRIYAVTGMATEETRRACVEVGMNGFIEKPVRVNELSGILQRELEALPGL